MDFKTSSVAAVQTNNLYTYLHKHNKYQHHHKPFKLGNTISHIKLHSKIYLIVLGSLCQFHCYIGVVQKWFKDRQKYEIEKH